MVIADPTLDVVIYTVVFSTILKVKWSDVDQATRLDQFAHVVFGVTDER